MQPDGIDPRTERHALWLAALVLGVLVVAWVLGRDGVAGLGLFCPLRALVDVPCPACGSTRVVVLLSEGRFVDALALAPLPALVLAAIVVRAAWAAWRLLTGRAGPRPAVRPFVWWTAAALLWAYALWRSALTGAP